MPANNAPLLSSKANKPPCHFVQTMDVIGVAIGLPTLAIEALLLPPVVVHYLKLLSFGAAKSVLQHT